VSNENGKIITNDKLVKMWKWSWLVQKYVSRIFSQRDCGKPQKTRHNCESAGQKSNWGSPEYEARVL
jgi:hypothetical protein